MKRLVIGIIIGVAIGFIAGYFVANQSGGTAFLGRCVNDLGIVLDSAGTNSCDGKEIGASCTGAFGSGKCQSTAN